MKPKLEIVRENKYFSFLWGSQILSQLTVNSMNFLLLIRLFAETSSSIAVSMLWLAYSLPALFFGPFASPLVDRFNKRKLLATTNLLQSLVVFGYALTFQKYTFLPFLVIFFYSALNQFYLPAETATIPLVTKKPYFADANSLFLITQQGALVLSATLATFASHLLGFRTSIMLCAALLFLAFLSVLKLPKGPEGTIRSKKIEDSIETFIVSAFEGVKFIQGDKVIYYPLLLIILMQIILSVVVISIPQITQEVIGLPVSLAGLVVIPTALGTISGAILIPKLIRKGWRKIVLVKNSMAAISLLVLGVVLTSFLGNLNARLMISSLLVAGVGFSFIGIMVPTQTFLQEHTPKEYFGRVFGNMWFIVTILTVVPLLTMGMVAELFSMRVVLMVLSLLMATILVWGQKSSWGGVTNHV